jgi:hypothetical protein
MDLFAFTFKVTHPQGYEHTVDLNEADLTRAELRAKRIALWAWRREEKPGLTGAVDDAIQPLTIVTLSVVPQDGVGRAPTRCVACGDATTNGRRWCSNYCRIAEDGPQDEDYLAAGVEPPRDDEDLEMGS